MSSSSIDIPVAEIDAAEMLAARQFSSPNPVIDIQPLGHGIINDTFLVTLDPAPSDSPSTRHFVLQRLNRQVFPQPESVMQNLRTFSEHTRQRLQQLTLDSKRRWEIPHVLLTQDGRDHWLDASGEFWRATSYIESTQSFNTIRGTAQAREVGYAVGLFHTLTSNLPAATLADTLPGFHITPQYLNHFDAVQAASRAPTSTETEFCQRFIGDRRNWASILETAKASGTLPLRIMHGDPKVNNILMDADSGKAVSIIDLDTVKPGLVHYDIGDCLRSGCNPLGEDLSRWESVYFDLDLCQAILSGYLAWAGEFLTDGEYYYLFDAIRLIPFELGLRYFTDYLAGNVYFKVKFPEHNLARSLVQFKLVESIEAQETAILDILREAKSWHGNACSKTI
jgi:Ser/Thr protein kinase RdoA (MazF antagonist)